MVARGGVSDLLPARVAGVLRHAKRRATLYSERYGYRQRHTNACIRVGGLESKTTQPGSVWGVCLARNEEDIIGSTVQHMLDQGCAGVIVVDNMSTDRTWSVLEGLAARDGRVHIGTDTQVGFHQGGKASYLAHLAWRAGADWVVPFDADEFWFAAGTSVAAFLAAVSANVVWCDFRNVYPLPEDERIDLLSGRPVQVDRCESAWLRVAFRARRWVWVGEGNHALRDSAELPIRGLHMLHYSYRSLEQYSRKVQNGVAALEAAGKDDSIAIHWRAWAALTTQQRSERWVSSLAAHGDGRVDPFVSADRLVVPDPSTWKTWDPGGRFSAGS